MPEGGGVKAKTEDAFLGHVERPQDAEDLMEIHSRNLCIGLTLLDGQGMPSSLFGMFGL